MAGPSGRPKGVSRHLFGGLMPSSRAGILAVSKHFVKKAKDDHRSGQEPGGVCKRSGTLVGAGERGKGPSGA